jgi:uncharacterized protein (DUF2236 family)
MQSHRARGLIWCAGDWRSLLPGSAAGLMQLMYPPLGQAVMEHSFIDDPYGRIYRSIPQIWATLLTPDRKRRGTHIRDLHRDIKGVEPSGQRYHALDPETFWWAHATFTWEMFRSIELYHDRQLTPLERDRFYGDTVEWYENYGVSTRPVPADLPAFEAKFDEICHDVLAKTPAVEHALRSTDARNTATSDSPVVIRALQTRLGTDSPLVTTGPMPSVVRHTLGLQYTEADEREFAEIAARIRRTFRYLPRQVNRRTLELSLRRLGSRTRASRYQPAA